MQVILKDKQIQKKREVMPIDGESAKDRFKRRESSKGGLNE
jgi:hypothetical protein